MSHRWWALLCMGLCFTLQTGAAPKPAAGSPLKIAAAADLQFVLEEVIQKFRSPERSKQEDSGLRGEVKVTYGSSGSLVAQLIQQAPFDLFLAADSTYPQELVKALAKNPAPQPQVWVYAIGRIVLWVPNSSVLEPEKVGMKLLTDPRVKRIAIANPQHAPYGKAARAALDSAGILAQAEPKLVLGENAAQAAQFVQSQAADIGILPLSLAMAPQMKAMGKYAIVPMDLYPKIKQSGVILGGSKNQKLAEEFRSFLLGPSGQAILKKFGFLVPED